MFARGRFAQGRAFFRDKHLAPHEWSEQVLFFTSPEFRSLPQCWTLPRPRPTRAGPVRLRRRGARGDRESSGTPTRPASGCPPDAGRLAERRRRHRGRPPHARQRTPARRLRPLAARPGGCRRRRHGSRRTTPWPAWATWRPLVARHASLPGRPLDRRRAVLPLLHEVSADPLAAYYLGQIYERTGRPERARAMFAFFTEHWADADPELQPSVQDARQRLARLGPDSPR
jgi:hypothetical protein